MARDRWREIVALRHRIVHDYSGVDFQILWDVVHEEVPPLLSWVNGQIPDDGSGVSDGFPT